MELLIILGIMALSFFSFYLTKKESTIISGEVQEIKIEKKPVIFFYAGIPAYFYKDITSLKMKGSNERLTFDGIVDLKEKEITSIIKITNNYLFGKEVEFKIKRES